MLLGKTDGDGFGLSSITCDNILSTATLYFVHRGRTIVNGVVVRETRGPQRGQ